MFDVTEIEQRIKLAKENAEQNILHYSMRQLIEGGTVEDLEGFLNAYAAKLDLDHIEGSGGCSPLLYSVQLHHLVKGVAGCAHFKLLLKHGADPHKACGWNMGGPETIVDYLGHVLKQVRKTYLPREYAKLGRDTPMMRSKIRQAIQHIDLCLNEKYPGLRIRELPDVQKLMQNSDITDLKGLTPHRGQMPPQEAAGVLLPFKPKV